MTWNSLVIPLLKAPQQKSSNSFQNTKQCSPKQSLLLWLHSTVSAHMDKIMFKKTFSVKPPFRYTPFNAPARLNVLPVVCIYVTMSLFLCSCLLFTSDTAIKLLASSASCLPVEQEQVPLWLHTYCPCYSFNVILTYNNWLTGNRWN